MQKKLYMIHKLGVILFFVMQILALTYYSSKASLIGLISLPVLFILLYGHKKIKYKNPSFDRNFDKITMTMAILVLAIIFYQRVIM